MNENYNPNTGTGPEQLNLTGQAAGQNEVSPQAPAPGMGDPVPGAVGAPPQVSYYPPSQGVAYPTQVQAPAKPKREFTARDRVLIPVSLLIAVLFDRLVLANGFSANLYFYSALFWLLFLVGFYAFHWNKLSKSKPLWYVAGCTVLLCLWQVFFDYNSSYGTINFLVIPCVLMAHTQFSNGEFSLKRPLALSIEWLGGWFVKPFAAMGIFFGALGTMTKRGSSNALKRVLIGVGLSMPLLVVILPLLAGADMVFAYYLRRLFLSFDFFTLVWHLVLIAFFTLIFYSFVWYTCFARPLQNMKAEAEKADAVVLCSVLGVVLAVYAMFCGVQFTYLFAGAGLPQDMTYSEYAREGFWQLIVVAAINLGLYGLVLQFSQKRRAVTVLLAALLFMTGVILVSGLLRLQLYIDVYGMTWLRMLSYWFTIYLAAVLLLCAFRLVQSKLPLVSVCAFILLGWYTVLGYANPDSLIIHYNMRNHQNPAEWVEKNSHYISGLSDDAYLALMEYEQYAVEFESITDSKSRIRSSGDQPLSLSGRKARPYYEVDGVE